MSFDSRERADELVERLKELMEEAEDDGVPEDQLARERKVLEAAISDYVSSRNAFLDAMLSLVVDDSPGERRQAWTNAAANFGPVAGRTFGDRIDELDNASEQARRFCAQAEDDEAEFVAALANAKDLGEARDFLVRYLASVTAQGQRLEEAWDEALDEQHDHAEEQRRLVQEAERVMEKAARTAAERGRELAERIASAVNLLNTALAIAGAGTKLIAPQLAEVLAAINNTVKQLLAEFNLLNPALRDRLDAYRKQLRTDTDVMVVLLKQYRDETQEFIEQFGYEYMLDKAEAADDALSRLLAGCATDGQKADAAAFVDVARRANQARRDAGQKVWDDFVKKHERKFMGVLGPSEKAELLGGTDWDEELKDLQHPHLLSFLEEWRDRSRTQILLTKAEQLRLLVGPLADDLVEPMSEELSAWHKRAGDLISEIRSMVDLAVEDVHDLFDKVE